MIRERSRVIRTALKLGRVPAGLPRPPPASPPVHQQSVALTARCALHLRGAAPTTAGQPAEPAAQHRAPANAGWRAGWGATNKATAAEAARRLGTVKELSQQGGHVGRAVLLMLGVVICMVEATSTAQKRCQEKSCRLLTM